MNQSSSKPAPAQQTVTERLLEISRQIAERQSPQSPAPQRAPFTCPIDPAERAACDSCQ